MGRYEVRVIAVSEQFWEVEARTVEEALRTWERKGRMVSEDIQEPNVEDVSVVEE